ncbi:uncharacterized protein BCR38DRAFT_487890 [Pseudomassariella vexata]|uniref:Fungal calcium binding protein domain-containing protein n=1 Tax=Pseudomassariella vexata TaxID=1141098 RepID=A0A1Y2DNT0_9PEZI|nr:uncharacterized protein BCR38DRAFT_487890 [Pseudomassariella vexata]ORY60829.1 hypothetical protein BCR38DRAFT_487890 [Pseudomassariella vexata]
MQPSIFITLACAAFVASSPMNTYPIDRRADGGDIASCEVAASAEQVAGIDACKGDAACIIACTATAVGKYTACAGV